MVKLVDVGCTYKYRETGDAAINKKMLQKNAFVKKTLYSISMFV
jgi:hypothetical protein